MKKYFFPLFLIFMVGITSVMYSQKVNPTIKPTTIKTAVYHDVIVSLKDLPPGTHERDRDERDDGLRGRNYPYSKTALPKGNDPVWQNKQGKLKNNKAPLLNISGQDSPYFPSDCNGAVGPNHFMQTVNCSYSIYDKTGTQVVPPTDMNTLFSGVTGSSYNDGDPIILYDEHAGRWLAAEFSISGSNDYMLVALSQTDDPTGSWDRWSFDVDDMPDYMKFGVWRDGYYMGTNTYNGDNIYVFDRDEMLAGGSSPTMIGFEAGSLQPHLGNFHCIQPLDNDFTLADSGDPGMFITINDDAWNGGSDQLWIYELDADWSTPSNSTFTRIQQLNTAAFDSEFNAWGVGDIEQPGTSQKVDGIPMILMYRAQYINWGSSETIICSHTVDVDGSNHAGIRWYELERSSGSWSIRQQGTYAPDAHSRWMGSIAMNTNHEIALGYSISSSTEYPGIRYVGQSAAANNSATGSFDIAEEIIHTGTSSQTSYNRWGDYSMMSVDPIDETTFWYTTEYYNSGKKTKIAAFIFDIDAPSGLTATAVSKTQIDLSWLKNGDGDDVMVAWSADGNFGTPVDGNSYSQGTAIAGGGTVLYVGSNTDFNHTNLDAGTTYYYKAWSLTNSNPDYSSGIADFATTLKDAIFYDGFESNNGWTMNGEWERDAPQGLGGDYGDPDPSSAFNGSNVLGLDLTGSGSYHGDYETDLGDREEYAYSPAINCENYENIEIEFQRWLAVEQPTYDHAYIDISTDGGSTWTEIWTNSSTINDNSWYETTIDISDYADQQASVQIRFSVGETDGGWQYCGWNIDDFYVFGVPVSAVPNATVSATPGCGTGSVTVSSDKSGTQTFYLTDNDGIVIDDWTGSSTSHEFTGLSNGTYRGKVEKDGNMSALSAPVILTNLQYPTPPTSVAATETQICEGNSTELSYTGGSGDSFEWYENSCGGSSVGSGNNLEVSPTENTTYYGRWENSCGESTCESITIEVDQTITANAGNDDTTCSENYQLSGNDPTPGTGTWTLVGGGATIEDVNDPNTNIIISDAPVTLTWTIINGVCQDSDNVTISLGTTTAITNQPEDVNANVGDDVSFTVVAEGENLTYQWRFEGDDINGATNATYEILSVVLDDAGEYDVVVSGTCGNVTSDIAVLTVTTSIEDLQKYGIKVYPNPSQDGIFNISYNDNINQMKIFVSDIEGKNIFSDDISKTNNYILDLSNYEKGIYLIKFIYDKETVISPIIIK